MTKECEATNPLLIHSCSRASLKMRLASLGAAFAVPKGLEAFFEGQRQGTRGQIEDVDRLHRRLVDRQEDHRAR